MLLHHLREHKELVIDALALLPLFHALRREIQEILPLDIIDVGLRTEFLERLQDWTIGSECAKRSVILNVFLVRIERPRQGQAILGCFDHRGNRDNSVAHCVQFGLLCPCDVGCCESIWAHRLSISLAALPPFEVVAPLVVGFVHAVDQDVVTADSSLAVEQRGSEYPRGAVGSSNFDFLKEFDLRNLGHLGGSSSEPPPYSPPSLVNARK